jgi:hypothetical protein
VPSALATIPPGVFIMRTPGEVSLAKRASEPALIGNAARRCDDTVPRSCLTVLSSFRAIQNFNCDRDQRVFARGTSVCRGRFRRRPKRICSLA